MLLKWFVLCLWAMPVLTGTGTGRKCPVHCACSVDELNRYKAECTKGNFNIFNANEVDPDVKVIIITSPKNTNNKLSVFKKLDKLEIVRVTDSNIPYLGIESFWGLKHLRILDLSRNNITNFVRGAFRGQVNLQELDLSHNRIESMASHVFSFLEGLQILKLAYNSIAELKQRNFFMLNNLTYLDLSGNPLQDLPPDVFRDVRALKVFKCRNCQLQKVNPQIYNLLPLLTELDFGRNEFKFLDKEEFIDVKQLTKVLLDGNQLSVVVDELFQMQKSLKHLDLSYNRLAKVPNNSLLSLSNLTFLDLSYNKLMRLEPPAVRNLQNLRILNISGNTQMDLHEIRETFELIPNLTHLSIADMGILPMGLLVPFKQLLYLNISGNHLDNMSLQVIDPCRALEFLDLSRNQLYGINEDTALRIQRIRNVRLDNNPLICDECHMGKLINVVRHLQWKWETYPICFLPKTLRGAEITDLDVAGLDACLEYITDEEQNAASTSHNFLERGGLNTLAVLGGIILVLITIIILSMAVCLSRRRARYYTREDRLNSSEGKCLEKNPENGNGNNAVTNNGSATPHGVPSSPTGPLTASSPRSNGHGAAASGEAAGSEINFKFPIDDRVCTIDELVLPPAPPPPTSLPPPHQSASTGPPTLSTPASTSGSKDPLLGTPTGGNSLYAASHAATNATTLAAVAAAATVLPPGAPTSMPDSFASPSRLSALHHHHLPADAVVVMLPPPPPHHFMTPPSGGQQASQQQQQQAMQLSSLEPLVSVN